MTTLTPRAGTGSRTAGVAALSLAALRAPFTARARRELLFCLAEIPLGLSIVAALFGLAAMPLLVGLLAGAGPARRAANPAPAVFFPVFAVTLAALLSLVAAAPRLARALGATHRRLAARLLGERVVAPPPVRRGRGLPGRIGAVLRDGPGWRAAAYAATKLPVTIFEFYAVFLAVMGPVNMTYPFWWNLFRNHPPNTHLSPALVLTPFGSFGVATFAGSFAAFAAGAAMLFAAPWAARASSSADRWLMRNLLGPAGLAQRVRELERARALAVDDSAALLRRVERDLHDGAQIRLATLAMNLGMAKEKLGGGDSTVDMAGVRELVDAAHRGAKDTLAELRDLARGIHPAVLDNGLADALETLAADSVIPVEVTAAIPHRPTQAIETIAYFCAAELLANAIKHSFANKIKIKVDGGGGVLTLRMTDDGCGGADAASGSGLAGLAQRVSTVDGSLDIASPPGGPTLITVSLPLRA